MQQSHVDQESSDESNDCDGLGNLGIDSEALIDHLAVVIRDMSAWMGDYGAFQGHRSTMVGHDELSAATKQLTDRLRDNYPYFHPRYVGQMLKPPHPAALLGYVGAMFVNPNAHSLDGGPATAKMEVEVVAQLAQMFGFTDHLGHLTSNGTIANLEALFVARQIHPGKVVAHSADAHYTHGRMCHVLGVESVSIPCTPDGTIDLDALEQQLRTGRVGTVVATAGTTGLGAVDPVHEIVRLARAYEVRVHVDAAYGGFFTLIADDSPDGVASRPFDAIADCDSVVIDPHKHGLQPYGCGAVLFRDESVAQHYLHDSPYTYFTSEDRHLGEISLECSRAGASAAALWMTLQVLPLTPDGLGAVLRPGRRAAIEWADLMQASGELTVYQAPELDILTYFPTRSSLSEVDRASSRALARGMELPPDEAMFVASYVVTDEDLRARGHDVRGDVPAGRILRSVLMKPETDGLVPALHRQLLDLLG
jgi:glutamate/tyrosine decarboxylase-like PLP-dependent enzyme